MRIVIDKNINARMRDGTQLAADVYRLDTRDPLPVLLQRLPYNKDLTLPINFSMDIMRAARAGYAVVVQDTRGRFASEGHFTPFFDEAADGADSVEWVAAQPWASGKVGMIGGSYFGATQWLAAMGAPDPLLAIAPFMTAADYHDEWIYRGGAFELGFTLNWSLSSLALGELQRRRRSGNATVGELLGMIAAVDRNSDLYENLPTNEIPELDGIAPYYFEWLAHPDYDDYWRRIAPGRHYEDVAAPALNMGGWYDTFLGGTLANYVGMKQRAGSARARSLQRLIVGPWAHSAASGAFPEKIYGLMAGVDAFDLTGAQLRWFDYHLKGEENGVERDKPVQIFVMGINQWRHEDDWPLPDTNFVPYYLHSDGRAHTLDGDGLLSTAPPADEPEDVYLYAPTDPVPTVGGQSFLPGLLVAANGGPRDQRQVERRRDVLCYTTLPLKRPLEVTGPVELILFASSTAPDTDFTGKLVDVHPDGRAEILTEGILRARYRESMSDPRLLEPNHVYEFHVDLRATANVFGAQHRIRLEVSSSNFPRFDRNSNTGGVIAAARKEDMAPAINRVWHSRLYPSKLILPLIERP